MALSSKTFDEVLTFTRASTQTYIDNDGLLKEAGVDEPAFDFSQGFGALSLWEGSTNFALQSENFVSGSWGKTNGGNTVTVSTSSVLSPDGVNTAEELDSGPSSSGLHDISQIISQSSETVTFSCFFKAGTTNFCAFRTTDLTTGGFSAGFDLSAETAALLTSGGGDSTDGVVRIEKIGEDGWYRCSLTQTFGAGTSAAFAISVSNRLNPFSDGAIENETVYIWGAQVEKKSYPTPYIPTSGATASRAASSITITGTNFSDFYNQSEGTFVIEYLQPYRLNTTPRLVELSDNTDDERITVVESNTTGNSSVLVTDVGASQASLLSGVLMSESKQKLAFAYKEDDFAAVVTGGVLQTDTSGTVPLVDRLHIATSRTGANGNNIYITNITYYPERLSNADLEELVELKAPTELSGLALWLDAADLSTITHTAGAVSQWDDKSGNGYNATQGVGAEQPATGTRTINSKNAIESDEASALSVNNFSIDDTTVFCVARPEVTLPSASNELRLIFRHESSGTPLLTVYNGFKTTSRLEYQSEDFTTDNELRINGSVVSNFQEVSNNVTSLFFMSSTDGLPSDTLNVVGRPGLSNWGFIGAIGEIIIYGRILSDSERKAVEVYLNNKWGL